MGTKGKVISVIAVLLMAALLSFFGVWAIQKGDFKVGGNIDYTAPLDGDESLSYLTFSYSDEEEATASVASTRSVALAEETVLTATVIDCSTDASVVTKVDIPARVQHDGKIYVVTGIAGGSSTTGAFANCANLTNVTLPDTITSIGTYAFYYCTGLKSINIPTGTTNVSDGLFYGCTALTDVTMHDALTVIGGHAFYGCSALESIEIPNGINEIKNAFTNCSSLKSISMPNSVTSLGAYTFQGCTSLTSVTLSSNVTNIWGSTFYNCSNLTSILIPSKVTSIGENAFYGCTNLKSVTVLSQTVASGLTSSTAMGNLIDRALKVQLGSAVSSLTATTYMTTYYTLTQSGLGVSNVYTVPTASSYPLSFSYDTTAYTTSITGNSIATADYELKIPARVQTDNTVYDVTSIADGSTSSSSFMNNTYIKSVTIPQGMTTIGHHAFDGCSKMSTFTFSSTVTSIGNDAFNDCNALKSISLPSSLTTIGYDAFANCKTLSSITIPANVNSIGLGVLKGCPNISSITVDASNTTYDSNGDCNAIIKTSTKQLVAGCQSTVIPSDVKSIADTAFAGHSGLATVTIPSGVTSIGEYAFNGCSGLTGALVIPESVTSIGTYAFYGCSGLTEITVPSSITTLSLATFWYCTGLKTLTLPEGLVEIKPSAIRNCSGLTEIVLPSTLEKIGASAFDSCTGISTIKIPANVTTIEEYAFYNCKISTVIIDSETVSSGLTENSSTVMGRLIYNATAVYVKTGFAVGEGITDNFPYSYNIVGGDFAGYTKYTKTEVEPDPSELLKFSYDEENLTASVIGNAITTANYNLTIPSTVTKGGKTYTVTSIADSTMGINGAFYNCQNLVSVTFPDGFSHIGNNAFWSCYKLTNVICSSSITNIGSNAFNGCTSLASINIPEKITTINTYTFNGCSSLTNLNIPTSVTSIDSYAFYGCKGLTSINIPEKITAISEYVFYGCTGLTSVIIPEGVTSIGGYAFSGCTGLVSMTIPSGVTSIDGGAFSNTGLTSIEIPEGITKISGAMFSSCSKLTKVVLPSTITQIQSNAFYKCSLLPDITIPQNVETIGNNAFNGCSSLKRIIIPEKVSSIGEYVFSNISGVTVLVDSATIASSGLGIMSDYGNWMIDIFEIYIKTGLEVGSWLTDTYPYLKDLTTGDYAGYTKYTKEEEIPDADEEYSYLTFSYSDEVDSSATDLTASITGNSITTENFNLVIPRKVKHDGKTYTVTSIADWDGDDSEGILSAFGECRKIISVTLPDTITSIGTNAFAYCTNLTSVTMQAGVTRIGWNAFASCSALTSINLPDTITEIEQQAFYSCGFASITLPTGLTSIAGYTFAYCENLTDITIPSGVTSIGNNAFIECINLTSITLPAGLTTIGDNVFNYCINLTSISIPSTVTSIGSYAFADCENLATVVIDSETVSSGLTENSTSVMGGICRYATTLYLKTGLTVGAGITSTFPYSYDIVGGDFAGYTKYTKTEQTPDVSELLKFSYDEENLTASVTGNAITIENYDLIIPSTVTKGGKTYTVTSIGDNVFYQNTFLTGITIPASVTSIGSTSFFACSNLESIVVLENNPVYDSRNGCNAIMKTDNNELVLGCKNTEIPEDTSIIGASSFAGSKIGVNSNGALIIPSGVHTIDAVAFAVCTNLHTVFLPVSVALIWGDPFMNSGVSEILYQGSSTEWASLSMAATLETTYLVTFNNTAAWE